LGDLACQKLELRGASSEVQKDLRLLGNCSTLAEAHERLLKGTSSVAQLMQAAADEIRASIKLHADGLKERIVWQLERMEVTASRKIARGTGVLATIGSTAAFVGCSARSGASSNGLPTMPRRLAGTAS
jgi:biopolymer transport protein ExbB